MTVLTSIMAYISIGLLTAFIAMTIFKYINLKSKQGLYYKLDDDQIILTVLSSIFWPLSIVLAPIVFIVLFSLEFIKNSSTALAKFLFGNPDV